MQPRYNSPLYNQKPPITGSLLNIWRFRNTLNLCEASPSVFIIFADEHQQSAMDFLEGVPLQESLVELADRLSQNRNETQGHLVILEPLDVVLIGVATAGQKLGGLVLVVFDVLRVVGNLVGEIINRRVQRVQLRLKRVAGRTLSS